MKPVDTLHVQFRAIALARAVSHSDRPDSTNMSCVQLCLQEKLHHLDFDFRNSGEDGFRCWQDVVMQCGVAFAC